MKREPAAIDTAALSPSDGSESPAGSTTSADSDSDEASLSAMKVAAKPQIFSRAQWGANERLRESGEPDMGTVQAGFIHHTVNANDYAREDVPALLRGI
ncbi:MAG: hypothetical protein DI543_25215 [Bradyrhizobium icense]|nr:MAG: hypothetical protein DI543_25215 [Bradyrhizobium icense]